MANEQPADGGGPGLPAEPPQPAAQPVARIGADPALLAFLQSQLAAQQLQFQATIDQLRQDEQCFQACSPAAGRR